jgi:hypothetical protein
MQNIHTPSGKIKANKPWSKAERILKLLETTTLTNKQIAEKVGCLDSYVRTVQQRQEKPSSHWDRARQFGDVPTSVAAARRAYRKARDAGLSVKASKAERIRVYQNTMRSTGRARLREDAA